ncbi:MAG: ABC-F family ATP-binding cassette domain-containing protein, partial [Lachnospiraceae bacterium]|nr:ABC-F family ATP-binding cassette domain-containing protein [Lachnospiraceae bacterium]
MILNVHALTKSFNGEDILHDVSFHIEKNEKAAIVGINGSGKTTLLKLILRQLKADSGSVTYAKDLRIGYLAQNQDLSGDRTIFEELSKSKRDLITMEKELTQAEEAMKHLSGRELEELSNRYVELQQKFSEQKGYAWRSEVQGVARGLGFSDDEMQKQISALSGGQKTRVALGKLLLTSPDLILL